MQPHAAVMQAFHPSVNNKLDDLSALYSQDIHGFQNKFKILIHLTTEQFSVLPHTILVELFTQRRSVVSKSCSLMASSLHDTALTCICGLRSKLC